MHICSDEIITTIRAVLPLVQYAVVYLTHVVQQLKGKVL